jgi:hypothetical protein
LLRSKTRIERAVRLESGRVDFEILVAVTDVETIANGRGIRELPRLRRLYGQVAGGR